MEKCLGSGLPRNCSGLWYKTWCIYGKLNEQMNMFYCQRSKSFFDLCSRSLRFCYAFKHLYLWSHQTDWSSVFHMELPLVRGKENLNGLGHMTKMVPKKSSPSELKCHLSWNLVYSFGDAGSTKWLQMSTLYLPWAHLWSDQLWFFVLVYRNILKLRHNNWKIWLT